MINEKLLNILVFEEGVEYKPYKCTAGYWTIGVGRNLETNPLTEEEKEFVGHDGYDEITKEQAFFLLRRDAKKACEQTESIGDWVKALNEDRYCALVSMVFQLGLGGVKKFKKTLSYLACGSYKSAANEVLDSQYAKQTPARAKRTSECFRTGVYKWQH